jgi:hypothetical protein
MCGGLAERRLDEVLSAHPVFYGGNPYQHALDILNGIYVHLIFSMEHLLRTKSCLKILKNSFAVAHPVIWYAESSSRRK